MTETRFEHYGEVPPELWPWGNFAPAELACRCCGLVIAHPAALDKLQWARTQAGRAFRIASATRCPVHNARVGGAPLSRHKVGDAFDIALAGHDPRALKEILERAGFSGFGFYKTFIHADDRQATSGAAPARWFGKGATTLWTG